MALYADRRENEVLITYSGARERTLERLPPQIPNSPEFVRIVRAQGVQHGLSSCTSAGGASLQRERMSASAHNNGP